HLFDPIPLEALRPYIDWTPFLQAWELRGAWPAILDDPRQGIEARRLVDDALGMLDTLTADGSLTARAVVELFPADATGPDEITVWTDERRAEERARLHFLRQQFARSGDRPHRSLADYLTRAEDGSGDWMGAFAITAGLGLDPIVQAFEEAHDDYHAILARALADRLAEAGAEWLHREVRTRLWGYAADEPFDAEALVAERFDGIRPAPGYPACPDHSEKGTLFDLVDAPALGLALTESFAMTPTASVSGWYFAHPDAQYFGVGRVGRDQVDDYARRKGWTRAETERWLAPNLGYDPGGGA
ncbi:MAG: methionine synthase, partial [Gemmatimonadetes bacterium]|nr:methionine synthase [Gemmatimonadota bacterium]